MNWRDWPLLADENIDSEVVTHLRSQGFNVAEVVEENLGGASDVEVLRFAATEGRVILTHDSDFGTLAIRQKEPLVGIVYLRPGHIQSEFTIATLEALFAETVEIRPPFLVVARRHEANVTIRLRNLREGPSH